MPSTERERNSRPHVGRVIQNAVTFDAHKWHLLEMNEARHLPQAVDHLFGLLEARTVDYALVGGVALLSYVRGRNTEDLDLIMNLADLRALPGVEIRETDANFARAHFEGLQIDVLRPANALFEKVRREHTTAQAFAKRRLRCATVDGLVLLKLYALPSLYRHGDFSRVSIYESDLAQLMYQYELDLQQLLQILRPHLMASDLKEVSRILDELRERIARFRPENDDA